MKQLERFLGMRRLVILTVASYIAWQVVNVIQPWMAAMGPEKFGQVVRHPIDHLYDVASLLVGVLGAIIGAIRALLNKDVSGGKDDETTMQSK